MRKETDLTHRYREKLSEQETQKLQTDYRDVVIGHPEEFFEANRISTTKYTLLNFFFKNLFEQFTKLANVYFILLSVLQVIPDISTSGGIPTYLPPLLFIVLLTMIKDGYEDYKRYKSDEEENNKECLCYRDGSFQQVKWKDLKVGDLVKVMKGEFLPADLMCLASSDYKKGQCSIETKNLDGETNLKTRLVPEDLKPLLYSDNDALRLLGSVINCEGPNKYLTKYKGTIETPERKMPLSPNNLLLRGCILRNHDYVLAVICYTGHQTKIMLNSISARQKKSHLDNLTGYFVIYVFLFLVVMCLFCGLWYAIWEYQTKELTSRYISGLDDSFIYCFITRFGNWLLIFGNFVPISMLLTLETAKFCQGYIMAIDKAMISNTNFPCEVHSSNLNEELGQIDYVLSDKTGTLTCNEMRFKYLIIGRTAYGSGTGYKGTVPKVKNVDFSDPLAWQHLNNRNSVEGRKLAKAVELLGLCHTIVVEKNGDYNAASPDELAFVNFAKLVGCEFKGMDDDNFMGLDYFGQSRKFSLTDTIEFTSTRKRMTIVLRDERGIYTMYCKGADAIMIPRFDERSKEGFVEMMEHVDKFADEGLRTLLLGYKEMSESEYRRFKAEYDQAKNNLDNRDNEMAKVEDRWETGFIVVGATAIEDRLQDKVSETIEFIREAGIKLWVLTGDKVDTAKNIGFSCRLLVKDGMELLEYPKNYSDLYQATAMLRQQQQNSRARGFKTAYLIEGKALETITTRQNQALYDLFAEIALESDVVLCCRVSPDQKREMVALVKEHKPKAITLAIGDGANDVSMITEAHVGVGIRGVEGQQAARAADYAIGEFKMLHRLMFFHGRECYRKNSNLILYNFFKNILLNFPSFWFAYYNNFSGTTAYDEMGYQLFNLAFTSFPIGVYSLFDRQTSDTVLLKDPKFYLVGPKHLLFNSGRFAVWFLWATVYSFLISLLALHFFDFKFAHEEGTTYGFVMTGQVVFVAIIFLANLKLFSFSYSYSIAYYFLIVLSGLLGILVWLLANFFELGALEHTFGRVLSSLQFYVFMFISIGLAFFDWAATKIYDNTVMKEHTPPATDLEFQFEVQEEGATNFVKRNVYTQMSPLSNSMNFQARFAGNSESQDSEHQHDH